MQGGPRGKQPTLRAGSGPLVDHTAEQARPLTTNSQGRIQGRIACRKVRVGVVSRLVIVVLHIKVAQLAVLNSKGAACIVDILAIQCLFA